MTKIYTPRGGLSLLDGATDPDPGTVLAVRRIGLVGAMEIPADWPVTIAGIEFFPNGQMRYVAEDNTGHPALGSPQTVATIEYTVWDGALESAPAQRDIVLFGAVPAGAELTPPFVINGTLPRLVMQTETPDDVSYGVEWGAIFGGDFTTPVRTLTLDGANLLAADPNLTSILVPKISVQRQIEIKETAPAQDGVSPAAAAGSTTIVPAKAASSDLPPLLEHDEFTVTAIGTYIDLDVLANDSDPEGGPLTVVDPVSTDLGSVAPTPDGLKLRFTPFDAGVAHVVYTARDQAGRTAIGTATITVEPAVGSQNPVAPAPDMLVVERTHLAGETVPLRSYEVDDGEGGTDRVPGFFDYGVGAVQVTLEPDADARFSVVVVEGREELSVDDSGGPFEATLTLTASDESGQEPVDTTVTIRTVASLAVSTNGDETVVDASTSTYVETIAPGGPWPAGDYPVDKAAVIAAGVPIQFPGLPPLVTDAVNGTETLYWSYLGLSHLEATIIWYDASNNAIATHTTEIAPEGWDHVTLVVTDADGGTSAMATITAGANQPPAGVAKVLEFYVPAYIPGENQPPAGTAKSLEFYVPAGTAP